MREEKTSHVKLHVMISSAVPAIKMRDNPSEDMRHKHAAGDRPAPNQL